MTDTLEGYLGGLLDIATAEKSVVLCASSLSGRVAEALSRKARAGLQVTVLVSRCESAIVRALLAEGADVVLRPSTPDVAWIDDHVVWFGHVPGTIFRHNWPQTAKDLWSLMQVQEALDEEGRLSTQLGHWVQQAYPQFCPDCRDPMTMLLGKYGLYWFCGLHTEPVKAQVPDE